MNTQTSAFFEGQVGELVRPEDFAPSNYIIDRQKYDYEGNWGFCRFNSPHVLGARIGYGSGQFDGTDYGGSMSSPSLLLLHLEIMLPNGAVMWLPTGNYAAEQVASSSRDLDINLTDNEHAVFEISGWPHMHWRFASPDQSVEVDLKVDLKHVTILPDNYLKRNLFAMWLAVGDVSGRVRYEGEEHQVRGTMFYDHPRTVVQNNDVPEFGRNLYTPMVLEDGSYFVSHYTEDLQGQRVDAYSFAALIDATGHSTWLPQAELLDLEFDEEGKPLNWKIRYGGAGREFVLAAEVKPTSVLKAWGGEKVPQTRKENPNIPLICDGSVVSGVGDEERKIAGAGLAEFIGRQAWF